MTLEAVRLTAISVRPSRSVVIHRIVYGHLCRIGLRIPAGHEVQPCRQHDLVVLFITGNASEIPGTMAPCERFSIRRPSDPFLEERKAPGADAALTMILSGRDPEIDYQADHYALCRRAGMRRHRGHLRLPTILALLPTAATPYRQRGQPTDAVHSHL